MLFQFGRGGLCMSQFGDRLKSVREQFNLRQIDISYRFKISQNAVSKYESGLREPPISFIYAFCKEFNISSDYLLGLTDTPERPKPNPLPVRKPADPFSDLTPEQRTVMETTLNAFRQQNAAAREEA